MHKGYARARTLPQRQPRIQPGGRHAHGQAGAPLRLAQVRQPRADALAVGQPQPLLHLAVPRARGPRCRRRGAGSGRVTGPQRS